MYCRYYGLNKKPFDLIPDPVSVFMSEVHKEALAILRYGVIDRKGFLLLTGDVGTGKTTLLQVLVKTLETKVHICLIANPTLSKEDFYYLLASKYGLGEYKRNKAKFLEIFADFLKKCRVNNERVLLIIDEAHALPVKLLEEIRLFSNQEYEEYGLLSIFLVGQPELNDRLAHERLLPLRQRIAIRFDLKPFSKDETAQYIFYRLRMAGAHRLDIFTDEAIQMIHAVSKGVPRLINIVCDYALLTGFAGSKPRIGTSIVRECVNELHIPGEEAPLPITTRRSMFGKWKNFPVQAILFAVIVAIILILATLVEVQ